MRDYARLQAAVLLRRLAYEAGHAVRSESAEAVHDLRVATRRLSNCLRLFAQFFPGRAAKRIRRRLDGLMDLAGRVRDLDLALELLATAGMTPRGALASRLREARRNASASLAREILQWKSRGFSRKWRSRLEL